MNQEIERTLTRQEIGGKGQQAVDARALHAFLENGDKFATWFSDRVRQYGLVEGFDFEGYSENAEKPFGGRPTKEYALTTGAAKELCMVERNAKGKEARLYFLAMEDQAKTLAAMIPQSLPEALRYAAALQERAEAQAATIKALEPKAAFCDRVADLTDCQNVNEVAKVLGTGEGRLWKFLKESKYVFQNGRSNAAYQEFIDRGYFRQVQRTYKDANNEEHAYTRLLVTGKGLIWLQRKWDEAQAVTA